MPEFQRRWSRNFYPEPLEKHLTDLPKAPLGDGQLPPMDRPPATEAELRRLIDYLADPVAFAEWFERLMQQTDPAEEDHEEVEEWPVP